MKGAILDKGEKHYTYMSRVFSAIHNVQKDYNWLITYVEAYPANKQIAERLTLDCVWMTGYALTDIVSQEDFQWIWAVLSGFPQSITEEQAMQYSLPYAEGNKGFWKNPITIQHPLAEIEIVPWDSSLVLVISKNPKIVHDFLASMPLAEDLETYNSRTKEC